MEDQTMRNDLDKLLEHFKIKPTYMTLHTIYMILKNNGYKDIPKMHKNNSNNIEKPEIEKFVNNIRTLLDRTSLDTKTKKNGFEEKESKKKSLTKEVYMFPESALLPKNVYVSEKGDDEKLEDNYVDDDDVTSLSESENSLGSEIDEHEDGYEIYDEEDDADFSE
jgi:hypothetical protein